MREAGPIGKARLRRTFGPPPPGFASILIESLVPHFSPDFPIVRIGERIAARLLATVHQRGGCCEAGCTCSVVVFIVSLLLFWPTSRCRLHRNC